MRRNWDSRQALAFVGGVGLGAALMYVFDPRQGRGRRAMAHDRLTGAVHRAEHALGWRVRDLEHRTRGLLAELRAAMQPQTVDDELLVERVRAQIGRAVSHPRSIEVEALDGTVMLSGPILRHEVQRLIDCVAHVRGVREVESGLRVLDEAGSVPGLQGQGRTPRYRA